MSRADSKVDEVLDRVEDLVDDLSEFFEQHVDPFLEKAGKLLDDILKPKNASGKS